MSEKYIILVAGGSGSRMQSDIPKQFIPVGDKPMLMWAIDAFHAYDPAIKKIVVLPASQTGLWKELCEQFSFRTAHEIVHGGKTRFESVRNAVSRVSGGGLTGVHDGVRPFPSRDTISRVYQAAEKYKTAVPYVDSTDSLRKVENGNSVAIDRSIIKRIQTPQVFHTELLKRAYEQEYRPQFTDDASVVEAMGEKIHLVEGNEENIKVTRRMDLRLAVMLANIMR